MKMLVAVAAATLLATPALAQDQTEINEIVVTGSRMQRPYEVAPPVVPVVTVARRADNLIVSIWAVNDTREAAGRRDELMRTLRSMARAAQNEPDIALSIQVDGQLVAFNEDMVSSLTLGVDDDRSDTSTASLIVKTPIRPGDTLDSASGRIVQFVARIDKAGRSLVNINGGWQLSIVNPAQYRPAVVEAIAADARRTTAMFGPDYAVEVEGMANNLTWVQSGPLDLALFIPYSMSVTPKP
ncbi:hypothetical protein [Brevundimonas lenta]|uniref:DUF541 domain-containing protein n=1 Tax=Brevundimonas lenta TaxID=424796 RepID=A0A7W6JEW7_9CAUL|nr:hypothetical protein [Brevundimonas lenta]MBB4082872.1 hypothetical protein [Brevundimonas lenta]